MRGRAEPPVSGKPLPSLRGRVASILGLALAGMSIAAVGIATVTVLPTVAFDRNLLLLIVGGLGAMVWLSLVAGRQIARALVRPVEEVAEQLALLAERGERVMPGSRASFDEIARVYEAVERFIVAARNREERLATAVGALAHDVRADLRAVATVLQQGREGDAKEITLAADVSTLVEQALGRARTMTGDLVLLLGMGSGDRDPPLEADVATVVREACRAASLGTSKRIDPVIERSFSRPVDVHVLDRIVRNLLDNAVRHARSAVTVAVFEGLIVITDDGEGFDFQPLEGVIRPSRGHGYGLDIAFSLAAHIGARVAVERTDQTGTRVLVYI